MNIAITGGGTGGHLAIAKAIKEECNIQGIEPIFIGSTKGQDREWFENESGWRSRYFLQSSSVVDKKGVQKFSSLFGILKLSYECTKIFKKHNIEVVFSVGGYSAAPASFGAILSNTPLFIHEQNAVYGRLNRLLAPFAKRVFCSFAPPFDPYPVRQEFFDTQRVRTKIQRVLFLGGSQGARQINDIAIELTPALHQRGIAISHQTGKQDFERVKSFYEKEGIAADVFAFTKDIAYKLQAADIAIARSGASTVWELAANGLPALFVPYPYAANNHQYYNAKFFVEKGAALFFQKERFFALLEQDLRTMSTELLNLSHPDGAKNIVEAIISQ